jgi:biopolymer transport protein ExbD
MTRARLDPVRAEENLSCNVIPLIDIMFLLLLFLMVGADMGQREWAELVLPQASHADASEPVSARDTRIVNVCGVGGGAASHDPRGLRDAAAWTYSMGGRDYTLDGLAAQLELEARERAEAGASGETARALSRLTVLVRADRDAPYGMMQRLLTTCGELGIYRVEVAAAVPDTSAQAAPDAH